MYRSARISSLYLFNIFATNLEDTFAVRRSTWFCE